VTGVIRYPALRDSGVEWIGQVPAHWEVLATARVSDLTTGERDTQDTTEDGAYPFYVRSQTVERIDSYSFDGEGVLTSGDGAGVGKIFHYALGKFEFHQRVYLFYNFRRITGRYFFYFLREHLHLVALAGNAKSTVDSLRRPMLRMFPVCLPNPEEQAQIATFLDHETARIDALIEKQQQLIALLKEKRQAVISHAVTKGLNPNAPLRDSGVEWLGMVPAHWTVSQLKRTWRSSDYGISESSNAEGTYEVLTMGDIQEGEISAPGMRFVSAVDKHLLLSPGDLLFNRTNSLALVGKVGLFREGTQVTFASYCVRLRVTAKHEPEFFNYLLNSDYVLVSARATSFPSIGQTNLNPTRYGGLLVAYPSLEEQKLIARHLNHSVAKLRTATQRAQEAVELLQERRTALISAAVTGKIDLRDWAPPESTVEQDVA